MASVGRWLDSLKARAQGDDDDGWVTPGNSVTRAVFAPDPPSLPAPAAAADPTTVATAVELPQRTLAEIEAATAEDEAAAAAFEAARKAALGLPPDAPDPMLPLIVDENVPEPAQPVIRDQDVDADGEGKTDAKDSRAA